ncbi:MAG: trypsin-like serine protease [Ruminococcaceae bacterium]|nr:trypsin-like serine protease [Oscillospiraceae bacterium]
MNENFNENNQNNNVENDNSTPAFEAISKLVSEPIPESVAEPIAETAPQPIAEPVAETAFEPTTQFVVEPVAETVVEPAAEPVAEPVAEATPEAETAKSDADYMHTIQSENVGSFVHTELKPRKKKKSVSASALVASLLLTALVSITGGALLAHFIDADTPLAHKSNIAETTVGDNITASGNIVETTSPASKDKAGVLTTPEIVDKVGPAVVGIINKTTMGNAYGGYYGFFGGGDLNEEIEQSSGSGVIISTDGYIITNNHVVENATKLSVILNTGEEHEGKVVGRDASTDLAVVKIEATGLKYAQMGVSSDLRVGETAIAIGNPLGQEFAGTTTKGIISGLNRSVTVDGKTMNLIQTDAAINPGNSGGALVNEYGYLIGINTVKISSNTLEGLGFAIPIDEAKPIVEQLIQNGYVTGRPVIGIAGRAVTEQDAKAYNLKVGVYVSSITPNGPAYMSGIKIGDIIIECEGEPIETVDDINEIKNKKSPGDEIKVKVYRKGEYKDIVIILGEETPDIG